MRFSAQQAAEALGAALVGPDVDLCGVGFDSRVIRADQLFVPLIAERNGHDFIAAAVSTGVTAYLTAEPDRPMQTGTAIVVDDTLEALLRLGRWARDRWGAEQPGATVIGVTGSVGKTSTKDLAACALSSARTWVNERSFNNDQGRPTTILNAPDDTQVMVLEMGMRGFGEIARLAAIGRPNIGVVTRVAEAHSERVGGIDGVARAKAELVEALPSSGWAILNGDDHRVRQMANRTNAGVLTYGETDGCDLRIDDIVLDELARASFTVRSSWGRHRISLGVSGAHMVGNATAAFCCAGVLGLDLDRAAADLASARLSAMRMDIRRLPSGAVILDDTYNANPTSMRAALDALVAIPAVRRVAVLGVMAEISDPVAEHLAVADYAGERGITILAFGTEAYGVPSSDDPVATLGDLVDGDAVLVKASRAAGLEQISLALIRDGST